MERRKAIRVAGAASLTLVAGAAGIALNSGIVGAGRDEQVGQVLVIDPVGYANATNGLYDGNSHDPELERVLKIAKSKERALTISSASEVAKENDQHDKDDDDCDKSGKDHVSDRHGDDDHDKKYYHGADDDD